MHRSMTLLENLRDGRLAVLAIAAGLALAFFVAPSPFAQVALVLALVWLAALVVAWKAFRSPTAQRVTWLTLTAGAAVYAVAATLGAPGAAGLAEPLPYPSFADGAYFLVYGLYGVFIVRLIRSLALPPGAATLMNVDALIVAGACAALITRTMVAPILALMDVPPLTLAVSLAYPLAVAALLALLLLLVFRVRHMRASNWLPVVWLGGELVAAYWYSWASAHGVFRWADPMFASWFVSWLGLIAAALWLRLDVVPTAAARTPAYVDHVVRPIVLAAPALVPFTLLVDSLARRDGVPIQLLYAFWVAVTLGLTMARLVTTSRDLGEEGRLRWRVTSLAADLESTARHDPLTGLPNRRSFDASLDHALARKARGSPVTLVIGDLDHFKDINDAFGHAVGDDVLVQVAERLRQAVRPEDAVARLGGDEFAVVLEGVGVAGGRTVADRILESMREPLPLGAVHPIVRLSLGLYEAQPGDGADEMRRRADAAMYAAKAAGSGREIFDPDVHRHFLERGTTAVELRGAAAAGQLLLEYQPIVRLTDRSIVMGEALVRWRHPSRGLLHPGQFIDAAEESGAIVEVGAWVLGQALRDAAAWSAQGLQAGVSVNVSRLELLRPGSSDEVAAALYSSGLPPERLIVEVTESALITEGDLLVGALGRIREMGVRTALDDFGTGYSSLAQLRELPVDILKLDRAFVSRVASHDEEWSIVHAIVRLAAGLRMTLVAEGVERPSELAHLRSLGVELGQGYLFGRPTPAVDFVRRLEGTR